MKTNLDFAACEERASHMSTTSLYYAQKDCHMAAEAAEKLEAAGSAVSKSGGYYRDEGSVYAIEIKRRIRPVKTSTKKN